MTINSSTPISSVTVFMDTMIFLHFKLFEEVDWQSIFNAKNVTLIISPVIFTELDQHKDSHPNIKLRKRAKSITHRLHNLFENEVEAEIRPNVTIKYLLHESEVDFETYKLNPNRGDDQQLAIILDYQNRYDEQCLLLTNDFNLRQRAKLLGVETRKMPDEYELADEPDPNEKLIQELQKQILELQKQHPALSLKFDNDLDRLSVALSRPTLPSSNEIQQELEQITNKYSKMGTRHNEATETKDTNKMKAALDLSDLRHIYGQALGGYSEADIQEYNAKLDEFYIAYEKYLNDRSKHNLQQFLTIELNIVVLNSGTAPADDLDIYLHFPDGFELTEKLRESPAKPKVPARPLTTVEKLSRNSFADLIARPYVPPFDVSRLNPTPSNVSSPKIRRTKSYDVQYHVRRVKHNKPVSLSPLYITFDSFEPAKSFAIQYKLNAGNVPREVSGLLHVIIEKGSG